MIDIVAFFIASSIDLFIYNFRIKENQIIGKRFFVMYFIHSLLILGLMIGWIILLFSSVQFYDQTSVIVFSILLGLSFVLMLISNFFFLKHLNKISFAVLEIQSFALKKIFWWIFIPILSQLLIILQIVQFCKAIKQTTLKFKW